MWRTCGSCGLFSGIMGRLKPAIVESANATNRTPPGPANPAVQAAGDAAAGQEKSAVCAGCHNADGNSVNPEWPKLAGQHAGYLVKQLSYFEKGERENATMKPMASVLDEQGREDVAAYYASQEVKTGTADPELGAAGEQHKICPGGCCRPEC